MLRKALTRLTHPLSRALLRTVRSQDPWARIPAPVPLHRYGAGARRSFAWYLEGESRLSLPDLPAVMAWLQDCVYIRDTDLFQDADYWQHPITFEQLRRGDCEDFALWAWRKLLELGYNAEFVAGRYLHDGGHGPGHTWVHFHDEDTLFLFDPVLCLHAHTPCPLPQARRHYLPEVSVDGSLTRYAYAGYYQVARANVAPRVPLP